MAEQKEMFGDKPSFTYDKIRSLSYMDQVLKESLRITPPLIQVMRMVKKDIEYGNYKIPAGHYIAVSPTATHHIKEYYPEPEKFDPERFATDAASASAAGDDEQPTKGGRYTYLPFGAGRHRCIGEGFAYVQIKTLWSTILSQYEILPDGPMPKPDYQSLVVLPSNPCNIRYKKRVQKA